MIRLFGFAIALFCIATMGTIISGAGFLWYQGHLSKESIADMKSILRGEDPSLNTREQKEETSQPSFQDIANLRSKNILSLTVREAELDLVKQTIALQIQDLVNRTKLLDQKQAVFAKDIKETEKRLTTEAREMARGILLKLKPETAAENLLALEKTEAIELLKGMSEQNVARILEKFPEKQKAIAEEFFVALARGQPQIKNVQNAKGKLEQSNQTQVPKTAQRNNATNQN